MLEKIIMDCDPGQDDTIALIMAAAAPELELLAVTTSAGNQTPDKTLNNAMRVLTLLHKSDVPVASGNQKPLLQELMIAPQVHGKTGLDGAILPEPNFAPQQMPAVELMAQILERQPEPVTLVVTGPMTNIALFLQIYPYLKGKIKQLVCMGGAMDYGNFTPTTEFNIAVDPEAAKIVFEAGIPLIMAGLDVTYQAQIYPEEIAEISKIKNAVARSVAGQLAFYGTFYAQEKWGFKGIPLHDPCTIAWLLHPEYFEKKQYHVEVETKGEFTRGQTVVDRWDLLHKPQNVGVLTKVKRAAFVNLLLSSLRKF
ncbi:pyrimidine-specific ribonucleoside hydrolase RihA [Liquorilactobacillus satsumensis]|uniref:pyrimidine-specific ribonucleoside hydrolase RihA n=1 Tax=Liquorilactobacillus satsumensis TaxID=259059 RepID=UPI001E3BBF1C|nr:pyrimidine-specific ribonucleoside hydrolase RihA [Liquorilactobacillus satsumensis]MCP9312890.1 pyrimidine-specific ribonucleoside hydrolase RihA [Liquorilactobacillus satsumensis]MCP9329299.1 pyrimidine-specific ribonucleoside hydrolase RihA [Liquorilactobacillus satsumensis]MCP9357860.1 pyrimidine-specific ribonucleoside hydrolase RihA [Liquorilactobacillus satsumensis]MCP9359986.1 pyrimidine-specific ribonucleoside hydrolase RihA [Liquorilactobacillus satsumensis]MCP9371600.1 pyrimidine